MASTYTYEFIDEKNYRVVEHFPWGESRIIPQDSHDLAAWIAQGNIPEKVSGDRFVSIVDSKPIVSAEKPAIIEAEKWVAIRAIRNDLLQKSDWTVLPDSPPAKTMLMAWKTYRQALRDIPQTFARPDDVRWPEIPV